jgi:hypothetical protein
LAKQARAKGHTAVNTNDSPDPQREDIFARHADSLLTGQPFNADFTFLDAEDLALFDLAESLHATLVPVPPRPEFLAKLKRELVGETVPALPMPAWMLRWRKLPVGYRVAAGVGGVTLTAGLTLFAVSRVLEAFNRKAPADQPAG